MTEEIKYVAAFLLGQLRISPPMFTFFIAFFSLCYYFLDDYVPKIIKFLSFSLKKVSLNLFEASNNK